MVDMEIALGHHLLQVPEAEPKPQVPTNTQDNDLGFEMASLKQCRPVRSHPLQGTRHAPVVCNTSLHPSVGFSRSGTLHNEVRNRHFAATYRKACFSRSSFAHAIPLLSLRRQASDTPSTTLSGNGLRIDFPVL